MSASGERGHGADSSPGSGETESQSTHSTAGGSRCFSGG